MVYPAQRGAIYDRDGDSLAVTVDLQLLFADPSEVTNRARAASKLSTVLGVSRRSMEKALRPSFAGSRYEELAHQVEDAVAKKIEAMSLPGIHLRLEPKRIYPGGRLASHVLGFVNAYGDALGGIELQYDDILKGKPGKMTLEQDPSGRALPQAGFAYEAPTAGRSLFLTIDKEIQYFTEQTLAAAMTQYKAKAATAIVLKARTGEILAMANAPDFDPNRFSDFSDDERRNRAVTDIFEPGSVFKTITATAALQEGVATPRTTYQVPDQIAVSDRIIHDSHSHPEETMTFTDVIAQSSNVGTIKIGMSLGKDKIDEWTRRFGFGSKTGLDFPGEASGIVIDPDKWYGSTISQIPLGQGVAVTPIQLAAAYGAVANLGMWVEPKLVHSTLDPTGALVPAPAPARRRIATRPTSRNVLAMLEEVVKNGTGLEAQVPGYRIAGKTGTAQKPSPSGGYGSTYIASFVGIAPADRPEIVVLVSFDEPTPIWGGSTAGPTFQKIVAFTLRHLGIAPNGNAERALEEFRSNPAEEPVVHD